MLRLVPSLVVEKATKCLHVDASCCSARSRKKRGHSNLVHSLPENAVGYGPSLMHDPDPLRNFARRYTEAWCSQDPARVAEHYAPGGSLWINGGPPSVGRAAITEAARSFMVAFPDMRVLMDDLLVRDDGVEYRWTPDRHQHRAGRNGKLRPDHGVSGRSATMASSPSRRVTTTKPSTTASSITGWTSTGRRAAACATHGDAGTASGQVTVRRRRKIDEARARQ